MSNVIVFYDCILIFICSFIYLFDGILVCFTAQGPLNFNLITNFCFEKNQNLWQMKSSWGFFYFEGPEVSLFW